MTEWLQYTVGISPDVQLNILISIIIVFGIIFIRYLLVKLVIHNIQDLNLRYQWRKFSLYIAVFIIVLFLASNWLGLIGSVGTFLGLMTAGIAIALKDPIVNIVAWLFILVRQPFKVGDRIQIGDQAGDVIDIRIFQFSLIEIGNWVDADQSTGRVIHIPNGIVFTTPQSNFTAGFVHIWHEIPLLITFESNWKKAKNILTNIVNKDAVQITETAERQIKAAAKKFLIYYSKLTPIVYTTIKDSGVLLTMRFLCDPRKRRSTEEIILEEVLEEFGKCNDIDFAYPTTRYYSNLSEGKEGAKPKTDK
ncbi:MAG: mechanosensitive ion channel [Ignavibacteriaceae bacterium]|nr:mechanosensitive ion channel [Ignavibacteriaceae bacterium]